MLLDSEYYFDKTIDIATLKQGLSTILGLTVIDVTDDILPLSAFLSVLDAYNHTGFSLVWETILSASGIWSNFEMAQLMAAKFNAHVVVPYDGGDNEFEYDWYLCDPQGNWFTVKMDPDEARFLYETKRPTQLPEPVFGTVT